MPEHGSLAGVKLLKRCDSSAKPVARRFTALLLLASSLVPLGAQVPQLLNYQGRVQVGTNDFNGTGQFKFALVNANGSATYWSNDGTPSGQPSSAVNLSVTKGLYSVLLGNTNLPGMSALPPSAFTNGDVHLRVWFNDGLSGFQQFVPDQRVGTTAFALVAGSAQMAAGVPPGAIASAMLANGAVTVDKLAPGAVTAAAIAPGSIPGSVVADASITLDKLAQPPVPTGGTLTLIGQNSTNVATNLEWLETPTMNQLISFEMAVNPRWFVYSAGRRELKSWTVRRPLTTDYSWKEWVREVTSFGSETNARTVRIQFPGGPTLIMSNAYPATYSMEVVRDGFRESLTIRPTSLQIQ